MTCVWQSQLVFNLLEFCAFRGSNGRRRTCLGGHFVKVFPWCGVCRFGKENRSFDRDWKSFSSRRSGPCQSLGIQVTLSEATGPSTVLTTTNEILRPFVSLEDGEYCQIVGALHCPLHTFDAFSRTHHWFLSFFPLPWFLRKSTIACRPCDGCRRR